MIGNIPFLRGAVVNSGPSYTPQFQSRNPKSRTKRIRFLVIIALVLVPVTILTVLFLNPPEPPTWLLQSSKQALESAQRAGALRYSERTYRNAETLITQGWMEMARQNGRLAPLRDYDKADSIFLLAIKTAADASSQTRTYLNNIQALTLKDRDDLKDELDSWEEALNGSLAKLALTGYYSSAELSYQTAIRLMLAGEYEEARESMNVSRAWLKRLGETFNQYDNDQAGKQKIWNRWVQETLDNSRASGGHAIIVDKAAHKTYLVKAGKLFHTYDCDLGYNSINQKTFAGDGATPEGKYIVTLARPRGSRYYKALNINYPNDSDRKRFNENKSKGIISQRARIGNMIEIHGNGGRNKDWTEGCIALTDREMDHIMQYVGAGTPVTIVRRSDMWP
jgi:L,D-peptidoglycan transpeptidase YkuD (ErfK/YbiS/YcfS/YnhG family)